MAFAPPPEPGSRIQELGDRLIVRFRPRRDWAAVVFLMFWLSLWTLGGFAAMNAAVTEADLAGRIFLSVWLCGWAGGMIAVATIIAWLVIGREFLTVTPEMLEVRKEIGRFARIKRYDAGRVRYVTAERFPTDDEDGPRDDFCLMVGYDEKTIRVGEGMGEREADYVASVVLSRIRPAPRWSDRSRGEPFVAREDVIHDRHPQSALRRRFAVVLPIAVLLAVSIVLFALGDREERRAQPSPASEGPPIREDFSNERDFALAMVRYSLSSDHMDLLSEPQCVVTSSAWTCTAKARTDWGPYAGLVLMYRCGATVPEQRASSPPSYRVLCGPDDPPPLPAVG
jgi:hypothetical protein